MQNNKNKPISVVSGATGFIGSHLVDYLLDKQHYVKCIVRNSSNLQWLKNKNVEICSVALDSVEPLLPVVQDADYIFHIAGVIKALNYSGFYSGNVLTTQNILQAALKSNVLPNKIIVTSSIAAVGGSNKNIPLNESAPCRPVSLYGKSKLQQEDKCKEFFDRLPITIIRPPAVYGERDSEILLFFKCIQQGIAPSLGTKNKFLSMVYVKDLVKGIYESAISNNTAGNAYFINNPEVYNWQQLIEIMAKILNKKTVSITVPTIALKMLGKVGDVYAKFSKSTSMLNSDKINEILQDSWVFSSKKAFDDFGFIAQTPIEEGLTNTYNWYKQNSYL